MKKTFWVGLCVAILTLAFTTFTAFAERHPVTYNIGYAGGDDSVTFESIGNRSIVSTWVDTNDAINIDTIYSGMINTDCMADKGFQAWFSWDSIPGDSSYPGDTVEVSLFTSWYGYNPRDPEDSICEQLRCDTLARYGYLRYQYPSGSLSDTLFYFDSWFQVRIWDSTSDSGNVNTEHKYQFRSDYSF